MIRFIKLFFLLLIILTGTVKIFAQTRISAETMIFLADLNKSMSKTDNIPDSDICNKYAITKRNGVYYISCLALVNEQFNQTILETEGMKIGSRTGDIITLRIPLKKIHMISKLPGISYLEVAGKISPALNRAVKDTRVDSVWQGIDLPMPFTGKDVLIGITDWGFDYTHPMFYDTTLSHTRIVKAWDQFRNAGPPPAGFSYGTEIAGEADLLLAQCDTFNVYEWATHASHVAGICGGSGAGTIYRGVAYEAEYLMATFLVDMAAVLDAYNWMADYASSVIKRLVINQSWGLYYAGNLDGTSLLSQAIDQLSLQGVVFVAAAGNNGDVKFHLAHSFNGISDTLKTQVNFDSYSYYPKMWGQSVTIWGEPEHKFDVSLKVYNTSYSLLDQSSFYSTADSSVYYIEDSIIIGADTIFYNIASDSSNPLNNRPHMRIRIRNLKTGTYKIVLFASADSGVINCWNVIELINDVGNWGSVFSNAQPGWVNGDYYCGVGEPACSQSIISVAAYNSEYYAGGNLYGGTLASFSSYGPTYDGRLKPDISAPGVGVISSLSSFTNGSYPNPVTTVEFGGRTYKFMGFSGTSMSSPMVTGIVALMLQANPSLTPEQVKDIIIQTAREDNRTGAIPDTGSYRWGWGKIHAWRAVKMAYAGINENNAESNFLVYPNPAENIIYLLGDVTSSSLTVNIYNSLGQPVATHNLNNRNTIDISGLNSGIYFVEIIDTISRKNIKFIKQ